MKHTIWTEGEKTVYFYDGEIVAKDGVIKISKDQPERIKRAWILGYSLDPETDEHVRIEDLVPTEVVSAESEGQDEEKSSNRRGRSAP